MDPVGTDHEWGSLGEAAAGVAKPTVRGVVAAKRGSAANPARQRAFSVDATGGGSPFFHSIAYRVS
jgi:hypothetical protein